MIGNAVVLFLDMEVYPHSRQFRVTSMQELIEIMEVFRDLFNSVPGVAKVEEFRIYTSNDIPVRKPPRMIPQAYKSEVDIQIQDMLDRNIIQVSNSPWLSPPVMVGKKDGGIRFCIDYRGLN